MNSYRALIGKASLIISCLIFLYSCSNQESKTDKEDSAPTSLKAEEIQQVKVKTVRKEDFSHKLISNGKLKAVNKVSLRFESSGVIKDIKVKNGDFVRKGDTIAILDNSREKIRLAKSRTNISKAELEYQNLILGHKGANSDTSGMDKEILKNLRIESGLEQANNDLKEVQLDYEKTILIAPFKGKIANIEKHSNDRNDTGKDFCAIVDNSLFDVEGFIMESELKWIEQGQKATILPFAFDSTFFTGVINQINPQVNENGLIKVVARFRNVKNKLLDGMNAKVLFEKILNNQIVVPRSSIVLRDGKKVVFTLKHGKAYWNYVAVNMENDTELSLLDGIKEGDTVIYSGNFNLAHESKVKVIKN
ncbi:MAG: efflux RND transporter periplasmic adaptor subunit [Hyphomicrobiales bacterium]